MTEVGNKIRRAAMAKYPAAFDMLAHILTEPQRKSDRTQDFSRAMYIRGFMDGSAYDPMAKPGRVMPIPLSSRTRTHARVTSYASNSTGTDTPDMGSNSTGTPEIVTQLSLTGERVRIGGTGERGISRDELDVPDDLAEFDAILRRCPRYRPTAAFYESVVFHFVGIDGLNLAEQAEKMLRWLLSPKGQKRTDIPAVAKRWLTGAAEDAQRLNRISKYRQNPSQTGRRGYGNGATVSEDEKRGARAFMARQDYGNGNHDESP